MSLYKKGMDFSIDHGCGDDASKTICNKNTEDLLTCIQKYPFTDQTSSNNCETNGSSSCANTTVVVPTISLVSDSSASPVAYDCSSKTICGSAPQEFVSIMNLCRELINSIKTIGTKSPYLGAYVNPNRFQGDTFAPPPQNIFTKTVNTLNQNLDFVIATTAIFTSPQQYGGALDVFSNLLSVFQ